MRNDNEKASLSKFYAPFYIENKVHIVNINRVKRKTMKKNNNKYLINNIVIQHFISLFEK